MQYYDNLFLFEGLDNDTKAEIASTFCSPKKYKKGDVIYSADSFFNAIGFIVEGKAFAVTNNKHNIHMKSFESGSCFGAAAIFGGNEKYITTIIAQTDIKILFITEKELKNLFSKYPLISYNYIAFLTDKIRFLNDRINLISAGDAVDTVFTYLSSTCDDKGYAKLPKSMTLLSKMLGISRASLYRCLDSLENNGKILREENNIRVIKNEKNS